ncbi:MAG: hypothetical protein A2051_11995 [Desulfovibrionales bacterium GWA2_65_9]|nr:MAG: hypothetical protein A2051_11995 [Desulfovibrionales bacterium GWA2_65_9]
MSPRQRLEALLPAIARADHIDVKTGIGEISLREFLAGLFSYAPGWVQLLFRLRGGLARMMRLKHEDVWNARVRPEDVPFTPGARLKGFEVDAASESPDEAYWIASGRDAHLDAALAVLVEPLEGGRQRFHVYTVVTYKRWTGPLYFNLIRPFHHLLIGAMLRAALRGHGARG